MDVTIEGLGFFLEWFQNISILVMMLLVYNFIPVRIYRARRHLFSVFVGIIFSLAVIMDLFIQWSQYSQSTIGFNAILIPIAGFIGGPVSAFIITGFLLIVSAFSEAGKRETAEILIIIISAGIGSLFYYIRKSTTGKISSQTLLLLLSVIIAVITIPILTISSPGMTLQYLSIREPMIQIALIIIIGQVLLGTLIIEIDKKKENEFELRAYKEHLEALVRERTADLERMSALHQATIESTSDGILVIDFSRNIRSYNHAASEIFTIPEKTGIDTVLNLGSLLRDHVTESELRKVLFIEEPGLPDRGEATSITFQSGKIYEVHITPHRMNGRIIGEVVNFRDITKRKQAEESVRIINQKLQLLSTITRHDILNQLTAMNLYLNLLDEEVSDPDIRNSVEKVTHIAQMIQAHAEFTRDYQDIGMQEPRWLNVTNAFDTAKKPFEGMNLSFYITGPDAEIYADPLLERVFYNLIDNSIRHGERVSVIRLTIVPGNEDLVIRYEDDGTGVLPENKQKIFEKGFGKHTGLGMFLIHEILSITGISIEERGTYGQGVLFEIHVPAGTYTLS